MNKCKSYVLAKILGEEYVWYPDIHGEEEMLKEKQMLEETSSNIRTTIYSLEGESHLEDFNRWKNALTNRTMGFKKEAFVFHDKNIKSLSQTGYIVLIRS